jgi:hypothetical protein
MQSPAYLSVRLPTGVLHVDVDASAGDDFRLEDLCGFGARNNPKRGFLFLSKVLGKHWPSPVASMSRLHNELANRVAQLVPAGEDALFVGMAETATGLGQGVFESYVRRGQGPGVYAQTTRYTLADACPLPFDEAHSHATRQFLYLPEASNLRDRVCSARTVVICDDEASTGRTFAELVRALRVVNPHLCRVVLVLITDFSGGQAEQRVRDLSGIGQVHTVSVLRGTYDFEWAGGLDLPAPPPAFGEAGCRRAYQSAFSGRLGLDAPIHLPLEAVQSCVALRARGPALVVGIGEFMHPAFCLARELAAYGHAQSPAVYVQSTSRSPILRAADVRHVLPVTDPYGEGIPNYLYNYRREWYAQVYVVHETHADGPVQEALRQIGGATGCVEINLRDAVVREHQSHTRRPVARALQERGFA